MALSDREITRVALTIQNQLGAWRLRQYNRLSDEIARVTTSLSELQVVRSKLSHCSRRQWHAAAKSLVDQTQRILAYLPHSATDAKWALEGFRTDVPPLREIYEELKQTEAEFGDLKYCGETHDIAVATDPIELEGVFLGDFEVQLHVANICEARLQTALSIVALDPHPAASNNRVTHPHVNDEQLCAGDGRTAIQAALSGGRICDFFTLVRSVLTNYNQDSPFIPLSDWDGTVCSDCGYTMPDDDVHGCFVCGRQFCEDCIDYCRRCDENVCRGCTEDCPACEETFCPDCMTECPKCHRRICRGCLEENMCLCVEENKETNDESADEQSTGDGESATRITAGDGAAREGSEQPEAAHGEGVEAAQAGLEA